MSGWLKYDGVDNHERLSIYAPTGGDSSQLRDWLTKEIKETFIRGPSSSPTSYTLYAKGELRINDRAKLMTLNGSNAVAASRGGSSNSRIGVEPVTGDTWIANDIKVEDRAQFSSVIASGNINIGLGTSGRLHKSTFTLPDWTFDCQYSGKYVPSMKLEPEQTGSLPASEDFSR